MKRRLTADTMNVNGKTVNVGIDVHKLSWHVTVLIKKDPGLNKTYQAIKMRRGGKRAIVAVSRKLIIRIMRILLDGVAYCTECANAA
jgi:hypothetical protein